MTAPRLLRYKIGFLATIYVPSKVKDPTADEMRKSFHVVKPRFATEASDGSYLVETAEVTVDAETPADVARAPTPHQRLDEAVLELVQCWHTETAYVLPQGSTEMHRAMQIPDGRGALEQCVRCGAVRDDSLPNRWKRPGLVEKLRAVMLGEGT